MPAASTCSRCGLARPGELRSVGLMLDGRLGRPVVLCRGRADQAREAYLGAIRPLAPAASRWDDGRHP